LFVAFGVSIAYLFDRIARTRIVRSATALPGSPCGSARLAVALGALLSF
jgi:hypothetical protein